MKTLKNITFLIFIFSFILFGINSLFQNNELQYQNELSLLTFSEVENGITFIEEHEVINKVFDSILNIDYCYPIIKIKKNTDLDYINAVRKRNFISKKEIDTIRKFGIIDTKSRVSYDFNHQEEYLKKELSELTNDINFFEKMKFMLSEKELDSKLIKKRGVELLTEENANKRGLKPKEFGKRDSILNIGHVNFSRVYYSKKNNLGIFYYLYYGGQGCGYSGYVIFTKQSSEWTFKKMIYLGVF